MTPGLGVEVVGRFVKEQYFGAHGQNSGKRDQFFFSAGEPVGYAVLKTGQAEFFQGLNGNFSCLLRGKSEIERTKGDIFDDCRRKELIVWL